MSSPTIVNARDESAAIVNFRDGRAAESVRAVDDRCVSVAAIDDRWGEACTRRPSRWADDPLGRATPRLSDARPTFPENHCIHL